MKPEELSALVREFADTVAPMIDVSAGADEGKISADDTLAVWMQVPECAYTPMFLGWLIAQGHDITTFSTGELEKAVQHALVGDNKNVMFDWLGDSDASQKPH